MPDGDRVDPKVLEEIVREVKGFGDNVKKIETDVKQSIADVRKIAEERGRDPNDPAIAALTKKIETGLETLDQKVGKIEAMSNRPSFGGGGGYTDDEKKWRAAARRCHMDNLARKGLLRANVLLKEEDIPYDDMKLWEDNFPLWMRATDDRAIEHKALTVGSDPEGGYWVTPAISNRIITTVYETSAMRGVATTETISTDALELATDLGQAGYGWVGETEARPETANAAPGVMRIPVHEMYANPKATQKFLEDAAIDVAAWIAGKIADRFARVENTAFVLGTGVKQPRGFLSYPAASPNSDGYVAPGGIEQIHSGHATQVLADGLISLQMSLKEPYQNNAVFMMRRATVASVLLLKDGFGQYLWRFPGLQGNIPGTLLGTPVRWFSDMPSVGAGALSIAYGDMRAAYTIVDRLGINVLRDPFTAKPFVLFYTRKRVGGDVVNFDALKIQVIAV